MPGHDHAASAEVKAAVPFVFTWIANENSRRRPWLKFVVGGGVHIGITEASKGSKMGIRGVLLKEKVVWGGMSNDSRWSYIEEKISGMKSLDPKLWGKFGLDKKSANDIIGGSEHALGLPVLRRSVRTR
jgi:hypothetical protein